MEFDQSKLLYYISAGMQDRHWYAEHQKLFEKLFGVEKLQLVANLFAATSINSSLQSNVRLFRRALFEIERGLPFSNYLPVMRLQLDRLRAGESIQGRKIKSFAAALTGDVNAVVVDIWLLRAFDADRKYYREGSKSIRSAGATDKQYTFIESYVRNLAIEMKMEARELSAIIWAGTRISLSGNRQTKYKEVLELQLYNMFEDGK